MKIKSKFILIGAVLSIFIVVAFLVLVFFPQIGSSMPFIVGAMVFLLVSIVVGLYNAYASFSRPLSQVSEIVKNASAGKNISFSEQLPNEFLEFEKISSELLQQLVNLKNYAKTIKNDNPKNTISFNNEFLKIAEEFHKQFKSLDDEIQKKQLELNSLLIATSNNPEFVNIYRELGNSIDAIRGGRFGYIITGNLKGKWQQLATHLNEANQRLREFSNDAENAIKQITKGENRTLNNPYEGGFRTIFISLNKLIEQRLMLEKREREKIEIQKNTASKNNNTTNTEIEKKHLDSPVHRLSGAKKLDVDKKIIDNREYNRGDFGKY